MSWKIDMVSPSGTRITVERSENNYNLAVEGAKKLYPESRIVSSTYKQEPKPVEKIQVITLEVKKLLQA